VQVSACGSGYVSAVQQTSASYQSRSSLDLKVHTAEGDEVVLSLQASEKVEFTDYSYLNRRGYGRVTATERTGSAQLSVSVHGDLSDREAADIRQLVDRIERSLDTGEAVSSNGLDTIAQADFHAERSRQVEVSRAAAEVQRPPQPRFDYRMHSYRKQLEQLLKTNQPVAA
jgi:hypothetical protein